LFAFLRTFYDLSPLSRNKHFLLSICNANQITCSFPELPLLLVNTRQSRATSKLVASVSKLIESHETIAGHLLDAIDKVSEEANEIITSEDFSPTQNNNPEFKRLMELVRINHGLLVSLGVSHPKLERIRELTEIYEVGATKLTGAGGGGCSFTLLKPNVKPAQMEALEAKLAEEGFEKYETTLGGHGVGVMWPAVRNFGDGRGDVEITTELHLAAQGFGEVEALVGSTGPGWRYWSEWDPDVLNPLS
jgi:mevalonate kinase